MRARSSRPSACFTLPRPVVENRLAHRAAQSGNSAVFLSPGQRGNSCPSAICYRLCLPSGGSSSCETVFPATRSPLGGFRRACGADMGRLLHMGLPPPISPLAGAVGGFQGDPARGRDGADCPSRRGRPGGDPADPLGGRTGGPQGAWDTA